MRAAIDAVRIAQTPDGPVPVVVLSVEEESDVLPIFIGFTEASAIARGLEAHDIGRPMTHDLLLDVMEELGGRIDTIEVSALEDDTYLADVTVQTPRGTIEIDARPSDSLALAARTNAPIEVAREVYEAGRQSADDFEQLTDIRESQRFA